MTKPKLSAAEITEQVWCGDLACARADGTPVPQSRGRKLAWRCAKQFPSLRLKFLIAFMCLLWFSAKTNRAAETNQHVPPEGTPAFDPRPLMDKLNERIVTDKYCFAVLGDTKHSVKFPALTQYLDETIKPDFVLTTGDMVAAGGGTVGPGYWEELSMDSGAEFRKRPWWPAIGNHEIASDPIFMERPKSEQQAQMKTNADSGVENFKQFYNLDREYYSFSFRNAIFIALPFPNPQGESFNWLENELKNAKDAGKLIFVWNHCPFFTVGMKSKAEVPNAPTETTKLFEHYGVCAVFSGHDHGYYRTIREGIPYLISAGGGAQIYPGLRKAEALPEDVYYFENPESYKAHVNNKNVKPKYLYHNGVTGKDETLNEREVFMLVVNVDGNKAGARCVTSSGRILDELILSK